MRAHSLMSRIFMVLGAALMLALSGSLAWAIVNDYQVRGLVPEGVTVVGRDLSGMTESQARQTIEDAVSAPMLRTVSVTGDGQVFLLDPNDFVSIGVEAMLNEAYSTRRSATFVNRLNSDLRGVPLSNDVKPEYSIDSSAVASWVARTAREIDRKPKDATRKLVERKYKFKVTSAVYGVKVNRAASVEEIEKALNAETALSSSDRAIALVTKPRKPKILESSFKTAIIVSISQRRIRLYKGAKLVKAYMCAPGRPAFPTPTGDFKIQSKQAYAPWINPGSAWAASMPRVIPGGPGNPMGVHKIGINYSGIFMHGVPPGEYGSIGTAASHGCMRMMPSAVLDLFGRVRVGDPVFIRY